MKATYSMGRESLGPVEMLFLLEANLYIESVRLEFEWSIIATCTTAWSQNCLRIEGANTRSRILLFSFFF